MAQVTYTPIGFVHGPYTDTAEIPKGPGAEHNAEGVIEIRPSLETGLTDIEGRGVDMLDGTPVLDIKPYLSSVPAGELRRGWLDKNGP